MADWQTLDPEAAREAEKYDNPIPSRELILKRLDERGAPASREQLVDDFGLSSDEELEALRRRLRAMERDGQLIYTRRGTYAPVDKLDLIRGRISGHRDGFGFLIPDDGSDDLFLSPAQMRLVFDGDRALARVAGLDRRGRREGALVEIIERAHENLVGRFFEESGIARVVADNPKIQQEVLVAPGKQGGARHGQFVQVKIEQWPSNFRLAQGEVVEVLGDYMAPGMEIEVALRSYDIPHEWPAAVVKEAAKLKPEVAEKDKEKRIDLRDLPLVTIDGEDARDFDDAVYAEARKGGGWRLIVAIADVSHYVKVGSALDEEATNRGNSVYFPEKVIPMLPEVLSNGLCSLNPQVDRLAMVCEMTLSRAGKMTGYEFYEAVIHSHARLTYTKVSQFLETPESVEARQFAEHSPHLVKPLQQLYKLYKVLLAARQVRGAIDFETQETRIVFGADRKIADILPTQRNDAHKLIEECMLCANVATARFLEQHQVPALYRVHEGPPSERLDKLRQFLGELGLSLNRGKAEPTPSDYQALLEKVRERPDYHLIQTVMLRSLSQAVYSPDNEGHFGLNYDAYTHFTSPIRRYPDLLVHRAIRSVIRSRRATEHVRRAGAAAMTKARIYPYDEARLAQLGEQCSMTERRADEATRDVTNWLKCEYMRDRVGETFPGVISAVTGFGIFVELIDIYVEGLVHVTALPGDYYHFDAIHHRLSGERSGRSFRLGDQVEVVVARVDLDERKIDFELSENVLTAPGGRNKRGAEKAKSAPEPRVGKGRGRGAKAIARGAGQERPAQEPRAAVASRRPRSGKVQALPPVAPEILAQAEEMLGNTDVNRSRALKQALLSEARQGAKASKGSRPAQSPLDKPGKAEGKGGTKPPKKKAKAAKSTAAGKPTKHRKGPPKPKAPASKVKK
ncbi:ribonuclease R [Metapseudomonas furukawaii]|uniref:Ribonuclease R n=1 Tax=Metapseudomonas furukawaii TaxID=1149133 RepID=A0AAD1C5W9_METFU|nr:ribonuclease R [Pseudomonas furukawaii]ELS26985.1 3'-to-5' exoribonuclease RNase R [Pseudomonas furukawaii]BAU76878.1 3'-to-5' exoribonuclease RNase R [Pseudomonas furukawaii]